MSFELSIQLDLRSLKNTSSFILNWLSCFLAASCSLAFTQKSLATPESPHKDNIVRGGLLSKPKDNPEPAHHSKQKKVVERNISYTREDHPAYTDEQKDRRVSKLIGKPCHWRDIFDANTHYESILDESIAEPFKEQKHK